MTRHFQFDDHVGDVLDFNPLSDVLSISAASPTDVAITARDGLLVLATASGSVSLRGVRVDELGAHNIDFIPLSAPSNDLRPEVEESVAEAAVEPAMTEQPASEPPARTPFAGLRGIRPLPPSAPTVRMGTDWVAIIGQAIEHNRRDLVGEWVDERDLVARELFAM